jgi:hypothetical protein
MGSEQSVKIIKKLALLLPIILVAIGIGIAIGLYIEKPQNNSQAPKAQARICNSEIVERYNKIASAPVNSEDGSKDKLDKLVADVSSQKSVETDPTCEYILLNHAITRLDTEGIKKHSQVIKNLHKDGLFPDNALYYIMPIQGIDAYLRDDGELQNNGGSGGVGIG